MAILGINLQTTEEVELDIDPGKGTPEATIFKIGTLDSRVIGRIRDAASTMTLTRSEDTVQTNVNLGEMRFSYVSFGLRGWTNFPNGQGGQIEFKTKDVTIAGVVYQIVDPDVLRRLPPEALAELGDKIRERNTLTETEAKN